jgi:hypothetical protein
VLCWLWETVAKHEEQGMRVRQDTHTHTHTHTRAQSVSALPNKDIAVPSLTLPVHTMTPPFCLKLHQDHILTVSYLARSPQAIRHMYEA